MKKLKLFEATEDNKYLTTEEDIKSIISKVKDFFNKHFEGKEKYKKSYITAGYHELYKGYFSFSIFNNSISKSTEGKIGVSLRVGEPCYIGKLEISTYKAGTNGNAATNFSQVTDAIDQWLSLAESWLQSLETVGYVSDSEYYNDEKYINYFKKISEKLSGKENWKISRNSSSTVSAKSDKGDKIVAKSLLSKITVDYKSANGENLYAEIGGNKFLYYDGDNRIIAKAKYEENGDFASVEETIGMIEKIISKI